MTEAAGHGVVLLVNDNPIQLNAAELFLSSEGFIVWTAESGESALRVMQKRLPDLIISDVVMPGIDGIELCRMIKTDQATAGIPILLMTALRYDDASVAEGLEAGADDYLEADAPPSLLTRKARRLIAETREKRARLDAEAALRHSETMAAMGQLVAGVAHEVRNPLFGISSILDAFEARFGERAEYKRYIDVLRRELDRLNLLMRDLLEYGAPPGRQLHKGPIEGVIAQAVSSSSALADKHGVQLISATKGELAPVLMDRRRLPQVFVNLLENAIHHSAPGEVVEVEAAQINCDDQDWVECSIKDSGPGFDAQDIEKVFDPFFTKRRGGTGLGLSIAERIIAAHGEESPRPIGPKEGPSSRCGFRQRLISYGIRRSVQVPRNRILIIDDDAGARFGVKDFLDQKGYEVEEADSCRRGLEAFRASPPDAVILDYMLLDGNALELLPRLKAVNAETPLVVLTGHGSIDLAVRAVKEGADHFLIKPVELPALLIIIERLLENQRNRQKQTRRQGQAVSPACRSVCRDQRRHTPARRAGQKAAGGGKPDTDSRGDRRGQGSFGKMDTRKRAAGGGRIRRSKLRGVAEGAAGDGTVRL